MINLENVTLSFGEKTIFSDFNLHVQMGEKVGLFGPTGCGKTSILNLISQKYSDKIKISYVFQESRLMPYNSALKNVSIVLESLCRDKKESLKEAEKWLKCFDLESKMETKAIRLSGGEAQRVNIARAFAWNGEIFLLDEPFSSQDQIHHDLLMQNIKNLQNKTVVIVSHNRKDLEDLGCRIVNL